VVQQGTVPMNRLFEKHRFKFSTNPYRRIAVLFLVFGLFQMMLFCSEIAAQSRINTQSAAPAAPVGTTSAQVLPFRIGLAGSVVTMFTNQPLVGIARLPEPFLSPLRDTLIQGFGVGIEAEYSILHWLAVGLRAEYATMRGSAINNEFLPVAGAREPTPLQGQPEPRLLERRTRLDFEVRSIAATPFLRARLWNLLTLSLGARIDTVFQMPLSYQVGIDSLAGTFLNGAAPRRTLFATPNFGGRTGVSISPVLGIGATLNVGGISFLPEIQLQTQYRPFAATNWSLVGVRGNVGILLNFPLSSKPEDIKTAPKQDSTTRKAEITAQNDAQFSHTTLLNSTSASRINTNVLTERIVSPPRDTVIQRDTAVRLVSWNDSAHVVFLRETALRDGETWRVRELYERTVPKARPFLVAGLNVGFVPSLGAARSAETKQASRLVAHRMIVRRFGIDSLKGQITERLDTIEAVKMPILRFAPDILGELGIESSVVEILSPEGSIIERFAVESKRVVDWDMQHLFLKPENADLAELLSLGKPLRSVLTATDAEGQIKRTDTIRIVLESSGDKNPTLPVSARTQSGASALSSASQVQRSISRSMWLVATLPVPRTEEIPSASAQEKSGDKPASESAANAAANASEVEKEIARDSRNKELLNTLVKRLPRKKQHPCTLYVNASSSEASALQYAQTLALHIRTSGLQPRIVRRAQAVNTSATVELVTEIE
jgi:hypothetical protein